MIQIKLLSELLGFQLGFYGNVTQFRTMEVFEITLFGGQMCYT